MNNKNFDEIFNSLYSYKLKESPKPFNAEKIIQEFHSKKMKKLTKNAIGIVFGASCSLASAYLTDLVEVKINCVLLFIFCLAYFVWNQKTKNKINGLDKALNFTEYQNQKRTTLQIILKQYHYLLKSVFVVFTIEMSLIGYWSIEERSWPLFIWGLTIMIISCGTGYKSIKNYVDELESELKE
jgi:Ca2+/Na+ antiporter